MNKYILGILKKMGKCSDMRQTEEWTKSKMQMVSILTMKIQKVKGDHHLINVDVNDSHMEIHSWVNWFSTLSFQQNTRLNIMSYVIYCQNDRKKICNPVSIHLFGLLLLLTFSLGLVMCLLPPNNIENEEMAVVKAISDSPGNF